MLLTIRHVLLPRRFSSGSGSNGIRVLLVGCTILMSDGATMLETGVSALRQHAPERPSRQSSYHFREGSSSQRKTLVCRNASLEIASLRLTDAQSRTSNDCPATGLTRVQAALCVKATGARSKAEVIVQPSLIFCQYVCRSTTSTRSSACRLRVAEHASQRRHSPSRT